MKMSLKKGQALILVCMAIVFLVTLTAPLFNIVLSERSILERERLGKEAFYLAEGALEDTTNQFISDVANFKISAFPSSYSNNTVYATSAAFPSGGAQVSSNVVEAETGNRTIIENGIAIGAKNYIVTSTCVHPANANITVILHRAVTLRETAAFQYAVFYNNTLEMLPGANMTFSGSIHGNNDIYIGSDGATLTINSDYLHSAGNIYNNRLDSTQSDDGTVNILVDGTTSTFRDMHTTTNPPLDSNNPNWTTVSQDNVKGWNGTVQSSVHGVTKLAAPAVGSIAPDGYYADNAGLKITGASINRGGATLTQSATPGHGIIPVGTITTSSTLYDGREKTTIATTNIDLQKLAGYSGAKDKKGNLIQDYDNNLPVNGLIYATSSSSETPVTHTAIRLVNGSTIYSSNIYAGTNSQGNTIYADSAGLTIVTNDPVYVQGNYNNSSEKPASVICDSVNILSNSWSDSNSTKSLSNRTASGTTVDTAFIAGVDVTTSGHYNGGLENYPRLLENWSGQTLTINGCFTELWNTQAATGSWPGTGSIYNPPTRNWSFDSLFKNGTFPPFTPHAIEAQRNTWWKQ